MNSTATLIKISAMATGAACMALALTGSVQAMTLTFDDLPAIPAPVPFPDSKNPGSLLINSDDFARPIPNQYGGFVWKDFGYLNASDFRPAPSGYLKGIVSPSNVAFNNRGTPAEVLSPDLFKFSSVYLTSAWNNDLNITIEGFQGERFLISHTVTVGVAGPTLFTFDWAGIDRLRFTSFGGTDAGLSEQGGTQFVLDNFTFNEPFTPPPPPPPTPIPTPALLPGLLGMGVAAWRRRQTGGQSTEDSEG